MTKGFNSLTDMHLDVLREIGTIGSGNAATALSKMMGQKVVMTVPELSILPFSRVPDLVGGADKPVVGVFTQVTGDAPSNMLLVLSLENANGLADIILKRPAGQTLELDDLAKSAIVEIFNIIGSAYINAISFFTKLKLYPTVPLIAVDMAGAMLNTVLVGLGWEGDEALLLDTEFMDCALAVEKIKINYLLLPETGSLEKIFTTLGVSW